MRRSMDDFDAVEIRRIVTINYVDEIRRRRGLLYIYRCDDDEQTELVINKLIYNLYLSHCWRFGNRC